MAFGIMKLSEHAPRRAMPRAKELYQAFEFFKSSLFSRGRERFSQVDVETNSNCNRACRICPRSTTPKDEGRMDGELYITLIQQLASMGYRGRIAPVFYNEPLLDERLPSLVRYATEKLPKAEFLIYTNGSLLTEGIVKCLVDSGASGFIVSQYVGNLPKDDAAGLIEKLPRALRKKIRYRVLTDENSLSTRGGLVALRHPIVKGHCFQASSKATIDYRGNVILCCNDYNAEYKFGNIGEKHILDIWNSPDFRNLRREMRSGRFEAGLCKACTGKIAFSLEA
ncbi:Iron-sulfur cluster-binding domain protein [uncultured archaeon]|nr:Iron-sulfur cluster-binding domain protein [uncultured archaeon]